MNQDSTHFLKIVRYAAIALCVLMLAGIATLMFLARGTGEDITGIVAPALLITFASSIVAIVAFVFQTTQAEGHRYKTKHDLAA